MEAHIQVLSYLKKKKNVVRTSELSFFINIVNQLFFFLYIIATGKWYSTGIVSHGDRCARPHLYGVYSNVAYFKDWIIETILNEFTKAEIEVEFTRKMKGFKHKLDKME